MLAPVITDGRTDERTNGRTDERTNERTNERTDIPFFLPFPKTKPLVPRGNCVPLHYIHVTRFIITSNEARVALF